MGDVTFTAQTKFESAMRLELNQNKPMLASRALERTCTGSEKTKLDNLIAQAKMRRKTERNSDVVYDSTGWDGIWVAKPDAYYLASEIDNDDKLVTEVDLGGGEQMKHSSAYNRAWDDAFLEGFFGDLITGKTGTTTNPFPTGNVVGADVRASGAGDTGMNVKKIKRARKILAGNFVDMQQQFYLTLGSEQIENLFDEIEATNQDYKQLGVRLSPDGKHLLGMLGFEFIEMELGNPLLEGSALTVNGGGERLNPFWTADGMVMAVWEKLFTAVDPLVGRHHNHQVYTRTVVTSSRTDQNRCGYIENVET
jgi:hypothetical protein